MTNRKGPDYERDVADFLDKHSGWQVDRRVKTGAKDKGDLIGIPNWTLECKNEKSISLAQYMDEAAVEAENGNTRWYAAIVKRRNKNVRESYVVMPLHLFAALIRVLTNRDHVSPL